MKQPQLPIYKAIYRGPITPFVTIGSGPTLYRNASGNQTGSLSVPSHTKAARLVQDCEKLPTALVVEAHGQAFAGEKDAGDPFGMVVMLGWCGHWARRAALRIYD